MRETKPYWYHNTAYLMEPYLVFLHFPKATLKNMSVSDRAGKDEKPHPGFFLNLFFLSLEPHSLVAW